jgi:effector-binding domain-containing protein
MIHYIRATKNQLKMKFLKYFLFVLLGLVLIGVILGLTGKKEFRIERSTVIAGSPDVVWPYVSSMKNFQLWSPWAEMDTAAVIEYSGNDGEVGSGYTWKGEKTGQGEQIITAIEPSRSVKTHLHFMEPMEAEMDSYFTLEPVGDSTRVVWGFEGENGFMGRIFSTLMNMDKTVGKDFEKGLAKLHTVVASNPGAPVSDAFNIVEGEYPGGKYLAVRGDLNMSEIESFYSTNLPAIMGEISKSKVEMASAPLGLYYTWDMEKGTSSMAAAIGVRGDVTAPAGMEVITLPENRSLTIKYMGGYHGIGGAHGAMDAYIQKNNLEHIAPVLEEYLTDPGSEPDSSKWITNVTYFVK